MRRNLHTERVQRNWVRLWEEINQIKQTIEKIQNQDKKKPESLLTKILGKKISVSSLIALVSAIIALTLSIGSYLENLPQNNITQLSFNLDPYPSYYWQVSYLFDLPISGAIDLNPYIKQEKEQIFSSIKKGQLKDMYIPVLGLINEGSDLYSITHIEIELDEVWNYQSLESHKFLIREFLKEEKYVPMKPVTSDSLQIEKPVILEPGQKLFLVPNIVLSPLPDMIPQIKSIKILLFSGSRKLKTVQPNLMNQNINELKILSMMSTSKESMQKMLVEYVEVQEYHQLINKMRHKLNTIRQ